ncbi:MAG TPA: ABC transporter substrate-binding protein [Kofleriaceae bacterium]|nr:ABC transporter substrate-binding protein [Kofleriaceae bacterium]
MCELRDQQPVCVKAETASLHIGQSAPQSGTNQALGTAMKSGIELAFDEKNAAGGIRGRLLVLDNRDDAYQPDLAEAAARSLLDVQVGTDVPKCPSTATPLVSGATPVSLTSLARGPNAVLAILGNVGTPTMLRAAPVTLETGTVFFGAFTGASTLLRDTAAGPCARYLFNVRASYAQEAQATIEYFKQRGVTSYKNIISFDQLDSFGQSGYDGLVAAYKSTIGPLPTAGDPLNPIFRVRYTRNDDSSVPAQVAAAQSYLTDLLTADTSGGPIAVGIMMTDTYGAGADFIQTLRTWQWNGQGVTNKATRLKLYFSNVSFVGANALADRLKLAGKVPLAGDTYFTDSVVISQVVPNYQSDTSDVITAYNRLITQTGQTASYTSLEGYISARVFIAGLEAHKGPFTAASLVDTFEKLPDLGLGIGATSGFSANNHQYSNSVWGTILQPDGTFKNLYFWSVGIPIQFFE